jgi:hypothetical protein
MSGHALFLAEVFLQQGARVTFSGLDSGGESGLPSERAAEIAETLAVMDDDISASVAQGVLESVPELPIGSVLFVMMAVADPELPGAIASAASRGVTISPLIYDALALNPKFDGKNAADAAYVSKLRAVGTMPILMPTNEEAALGN